jgi:hypothetical protein
MALGPAPARVLGPLGLSAQGQNRGGDLPGGTDGVAAQIQVGSAGLSVPQGFDWEGGVRQGGAHRGRRAMSVNKAAGNSSTAAWTNGSWR